MSRILFIFSIFVSLPLLAFRPGILNPGVDSALTGFIDIVVESNVNTVNFTYPISSVNLDERIEPETGKDRTAIIVPVKDFRCGNKMARKDFLNLLKADEFPYLSIEIPSGVLDDLEFRKSVKLHNVLVNIAGVSRYYDITCVAENSVDGNILVGTIKVGLSDLNLKPPEKLFGMVKVNNDVIVKFGLGLNDQSFARR